MFIDIAGHRPALLTAIVSLLALATVVSAGLWQSSGRVLAMRAGEALARTESSLHYYLRFKLPGEAAAALGFASATAPAASAAEGVTTSLPVLLYHGESGGPSMTTATFVNHMRALHDAGWHTVTMAQFDAFMRGEATLPDKSFLLTFDDGRTDTFYLVDPVLKDLGYTAVMFVITGLSLPNNGDAAVNGFYLDKSELAYMAASGRWELESHGGADHAGYDVPSATSTPDSLTMVPSTHFLSNRFWLPEAGRLESLPEYETRITNDLKTAKQVLTDDFGANVIGYAYPFNDFGQESVNTPDAATPAIARAVQSSYRYAFYQTWPGNGDTFNYPDGGYRIKRIEPGPQWSGTDLLAMLAGGRAKSLPYGAHGTFGRDWQANWGTAEPDAGALVLRATKETTGAAAFLDGTESWRDYAITLGAHINYGTLSLIARHTETDAPYVVCAFSDDRIYLEKHAGDTQVTLASKPYTPPPAPGEYTVSLSVAGSEASCGAYGVSVHARIPGLPTAGGTGVTVWDPGLGAAQARLTDFSATML